MSELSTILDGARVVKARDRGGFMDELAVWKGGHTVNFYGVAVADGRISASPVAAAEIDYGIDEPDQDDALRRIRDLWGGDDPEDESS